MATTNNASRKDSKVLLFTVLVLFAMSSFLNSQTHIVQKIELPDCAIQSILQGIKSQNEGVRKSCIYFAGKYKVLEASDCLVEELTNLDDSELSSMLVGSLFQIGNDSCCKELQTIVKNHDSEKLRNFCAYLSKIKEFELALENYD